MRVSPQLKIIFGYPLSTKENEKAYYSTLRPLLFRFYPHPLLPYFLLFSFSFYSSLESLVSNTKCSLVYISKSHVQLSICDILIKLWLQTHLTVSLIHVHFSAAQLSWRKSALKTDATETSWSLTQLGPPRGPESLSP